jgi:hypothetical protein
MDRKRSNSSHSTLEELPSEKRDPLLDHLKNEDAFTSGQNIDDLRRRNTTTSDLESQSPMGRNLTRADTAAYITKHVSRIPDAGKNLFEMIVNC